VRYERRLARPVTSLRREPVVITCATDAHYVEPLAVMLQSVLTNLNPDRTAVIYVLDGGVEKSQKAKLTQGLAPGRATVHWITVDPTAYAGAPLWGRMPVSTYYKLALADMLPPEVHRVIWLDCDLLVTADLARLWDIDLAGNHLRAVQDSIVPLVSSPFGIAAWEQLGIARDAKYFNAGVMVVDVDRWRGDTVPQRVLDYLRRFSDSVFFWDQEGLNAVLVGRWGELDHRWNCNASIPRPRRTPRVTIGESEAAPMNDRPWIIHWAGHLKPWRYPGRDPERLLYFHYLDMTEWAGWRPPESLTTTLIGLYESSGLRARLYPAEQWGLRLVRRLSRRTVPVQMIPTETASPALAESVRPADTR
jgi:lipopolysaccharide biosynthesis glycosyltransferase